jgi:ribose-phosphate pyrophosphokinase
MTPYGRTTLDDALKRVVVALKPGNKFPHSLWASQFLNYVRGEGRDAYGVLPYPGDINSVSNFSARERRFMFVPREHGSGGKHPFDPHVYLDDFGSFQPFFNQRLGRELEGKTVYIATTPSTDMAWRPGEMVFNMAQATQTAKDLGAERVIAVFSEFPFARQDRGVRSKYLRDLAVGGIEKDRLKHGGQTDYVSVVLRALMPNGCDGVVTMHHHSGHFADTATACLEELSIEPQLPFAYNLSPSPLIARYLVNGDGNGNNVLDEDDRANNGQGILFIAPDIGALPFVKEVREMSGYTNSGLAYINKVRTVPNDPSSLRGELVFDDSCDQSYEGKTGIILDDMIDKGGTLANTLKQLPDGIRRFVVYATHGLFNEGAEERMRTHSRIDDLIVMDTRPSRLRVLDPGMQTKLTILRPGSYVAHALAHCVEPGRDPHAFYSGIFEKDPSFFDSLVSVRTFHNEKKFHD